MTAAELRIRFAIAADQYERELEKVFQASNLGLRDYVEMPSATMLFWNEEMLKQEREGWENYTK